MRGQHLLSQPYLACLHGGDMSDPQDFGWPGYSLLSDEEKVRAWEIYAYWLVCRKLREWPLTVLTSDPALDVGLVE